MGQKKEVKLGDIAEELGISIVTVSNALKGKKGVSERLRIEIEKKAQELGYQMKGLDRKKEQTGYQIGVIIAERYVREFPSFYMDVYKRVAQEITRRGSLTILEVVNEQKEKLETEFSVFAEVTVEGIIMIGEMNPDYIQRIKQECVYPVVCVDYYGEFGDLDYIVTDSFRGMQLVTQLLVDCGHKEIGFIGTPPATNSIMDRYMGYCKTLMENHLEENRDWLIFDRRPDGYGYKIDFELPESLPTAFACNCDKTACILIQKLAEKGLKVPEDVSVVGFDYGGFQVDDQIRLTTYESDQRAMAQISVNTLIKRIEGRGNPEGVRIVEGSMIKGNTIKQLEG